MMNRLPATLAFLLSLGLATAASADCTVRYKAKQDNPLQLQAGEVMLPDAACTSESAAAAALQPILAGRAGRFWQSPPSFQGTEAGGAWA